MDDNLTPSGGACSLVSGVYWQIQPQDERLYRLILEAFYAKQQIRLRLNGAQRSCTVAYAFVDAE